MSSEAILNLLKPIRAFDAKLNLSPLQPICADLSLLGLTHKAHFGLLKRNLNLLNQFRPSEANLGLSSEVYA